MADKKGLLAGFASLLFTLYFLSAGVMSPYYWYKDVKANDGFIRAAVWSPLVGGFKATHWPYYAFFRDKDDQAEQDQSEDDELALAMAEFDQAGTCYAGALALLMSIDTSEDAEEDLAAARDLLMRSQFLVTKLNYSAIDEAKPGAADAIQAHFLEALRLYIRGLEEKDKLDFARGDAAMARFVAWVAENQSSE